MSDISIHKLGDKEYGLVTVLRDAKKLMVFGNSLRWKIDPSKFWWDQIILPAGKWELVGKGSELSEAQWKEIVNAYIESDEIDGEIQYWWMAWNYETEDYECDNPRESGLSWLKSLNHDPDTTIILIKKP